MGSEDINCLSMAQTPIFCRKWLLLLAFLLTALLAQNDSEEGASASKGPSLPRPVRGRTLTSQNPPQTAAERKFWNDRRCGRLGKKLERLESKFAAKCDFGNDGCGRFFDSCGTNYPDCCEGLYCYATFPPFCNFL